MRKNKGSGQNDAEEQPKGKPVDTEFWNYLNQERDFLVSNLFAKNSDLTWLDCEDVVGEFAEFYAEKADELGESARRFEKLNRINLVSRVEWKKKDFLIRRKAVRRGGNVPHASLDDEEFSDWNLTPAIDWEEVGLSAEAEVLLSALDEASKLCEGKRLGVVEALQRWVKGGCRSESWCDELLTEEIEEYLKLKKGKSLEGKVSATFSKVKRVLREIMEQQGMRDRLSA